MRVSRPFRVDEPIVQISLDLTSLDEAIAYAEAAVRAGVDWLEVGTPLLLSEGCRAVAALRERFPDRAIVADAKIMDGGYLEAELLAQAGASWVVVMAVAHPATVRAVVRAGQRYGVGVMADLMAAPDPVDAARQMEQFGVDVLLVHTSYDARNEDPSLSPLDELEAVFWATKLPLQAVGGLSPEQAVRMPTLGAPLVVLGAPLVIDAHAFRPATSGEELEALLRDLVQKTKAQPIRRRPSEGG
ncbi:MAG: D-arabino 3-hexulose 6-phosphate aldehyde lyase [Candidatus Poribacteria bacterium]|nr:MAG: D-arabino 3-hexulose 6-phosphate aldehyde lyase [Candidatus Poribacteria bacterium]